MKFVHQKFVLSLSALIFLAFVATFQTKAQTAKADELNLPSNLLANAGVTGAWRINYAESDNTLVKAQSLLKNQLAQNAEVQKNNMQPTISISLFPPETLVLANENENAMTINEGYSNVILTRTILTNGKTQIGKIEGGNFLVSASRSKDRLAVETVSPRGNILTETFEITDQGRKLNVVVRIEDATHKEMITLMRVYDRTILELFDGVSTEIQ
ncbi:MAG: hypothetical protein LUM44_15225 [Pyrinomonadaceae bacterium]|nr:hypothetical protein [Pyrinomonadaceae bacterium]